ncbi:BTB And Kelch [Ancylostoma duodenale]|uniref:BTB And Kelch n=1 Tax=Ancylostoma duodenale TaxID=51022 RepID=A0A0C2D4E6_9BILA|nr:BTB And Kelch [Ancylostoma duodenale]
MEPQDTALYTIDYPTLSSLIAYAYGGSLTVTEDNAQTIMAAASYLELLDVTERSAVLEVERFIERNFVSISYTEKFLELSLEEVVELLSKDQLHVPSEEEVFRAAMRWVEHLPERTKVLERILTCIRLHLLDRTFLVNEVARNPTIRGSNACREMVDDVKDFHLIAAKAPVSLLLSRPQRCNDCAWAIYVAAFLIGVKA